MFCNTPIRRTMGLTARVSPWGPRAATGGLVWRRSLTWRRGPAWRRSRYHGAALARTDYVRF